MPAVWHPGVRSTPKGRAAEEARVDAWPLPLLRLIELEPLAHRLAHPPPYLAVPAARCCLGPLAARAARAAARERMVEDGGGVDGVHRPRRQREVERVRMEPPLASRARQGEHVPNVHARVPRELLDEEGVVAALVEPAHESARVLGVAVHGELRENEGLVARDGVLGAAQRTELGALNVEVREREALVGPSLGEQRVGQTVNASLRPRRRSPADALVLVTARRCRLCSCCPTTPRAC